MFWVLLRLTASGRKTRSQFRSEAKQAISCARACWMTVCRHASREGRLDLLLVESAGILEPLPLAAPRRGRRTALTLPLLPPPQKNRSPPSHSRPETPTPGGISSLSRTSPVRGSTRLKSLSSPSQVACQSSPSTQVTPVTKRLDSIVRRIAPVWGSS
jgi:hypothetical protein